MLSRWLDDTITASILLNAGLEVAIYWRIAVASSHARRLEGSADIDVCSFIYAHDVIHILNNMNTFGPLTPTVLARPNELDSWSHDTADCHKRIAIKQH